jgi:uncharacterized protein YeaO (DUF488 family)
MDTTHKMSAYECYQHYNALKLHFTRPDYDYFRYNHKTRTSLTSFESRKDKLFFQKVAKHKDPVKYMLSNLVHNPKLWIKDIAYSPEAEKIYQQWVKRNQAFSYMFSEEISKLKEDFNSNYIINNNEHPYIIKLYLRGDISLETFIALVDSVNCLAYWNRKMEYDPVWQELAIKIVKYRPFLEYKRPKIKKILVDKFSNV